MPTKPDTYLRPGVTLKPGEILAAGGNHFEVDIVNLATRNGLTWLTWVQRNRFAAPMPQRAAALAFAPILQSRTASRSSLRSDHCIARSSGDDPNGGYSFTAEITEFPTCYRDLERAQNSHTKRPVTASRKRKMPRVLNIRAWYERAQSRALYDAAPDQAQRSPRSMSTLSSASTRLRRYRRPQFQAAKEGLGHDNARRRTRGG